MLPLFISGVPMDLFDITPKPVKITITHPGTNLPIFWVELVGRDSPEYAEAMTNMLLSLGSKSFVDLPAAEKVRQDALVTANLIKNWGSFSDEFTLPEFNLENVIKVLSTDGLKWLRAQLSEALNDNSKFFF